MPLNFQALIDKIDLPFQLDGAKIGLVIFLTVCQQTSFMKHQHSIFNSI
jgi:hypothetical protein